MNAPRPLFLSALQALADRCRSTSLVQTRAFSFSDDSAHVHLPFHSQSSTSRHSSPQSHVFLQSFDSALDLFRIRQIQSEWYMDLFQSGRDPWQDPYPYIWKMYNRMTEWFQEMAQSTLPAVKSFAELELLYSYVYILSPSPRIPHIQEYAQRLIFEHCIAYATNLLTQISNPSNTTKPIITFYDAMRAYMTGRQFVDVLSHNMDIMLDPVPPVPLAPATPTVNSEDPLAPPAPISAPQFPAPLVPDGQAVPYDPTTRAINAVNDFTTILSRFGLRFGFTHWRDRFQRESSAVLSQLYRRSSLSPHVSPAIQELPYQTPTQPTYHLQPWTPVSATSPSQRSYQQSLPTTPPTAQTNYFSSSPFGSTTFGPSSQSQASDWTTPSPQPMPDMPQPSGGRVRQALVYGPGILAQPQAFSPGAGGPVQYPSDQSQTQGQTAQGQAPGQPDVTWA
jgi:hypothetical protein